MGNLGPQRIRFDVLPEAEWVTDADGRLYEWDPTAAGRPVRPLVAAAPPAETAAAADAASHADRR